MKKIIFTIILTINLCNLGFGQEKSQPRQIDHGGGGVSNGRPINLPKPPLASCDCKLDSPIQTVKVEIEIDESGNVVKAKAISGHLFYRQLVEKAALSSKFKPSYLGGFRQPAYTELIYTFDFSEQVVFITDSPVKIRKVAYLGIINGMAIKLPKPEYTQEAKNFCANGKVEVEVLVNEYGNVIQAKANFGDELLQKSSVEAAKKAKFRNSEDGSPEKIKGIVVYNFPSEKKCLDGGIANKKARLLPKPVISNLFFPKQLQIVKVAILVDENGKVTYARAISGHPLLRQACENAARKALFSPINDVGKISVKALLVYKIKPDGTVEL